VVPYSNITFCTTSIKLYLILNIQIDNIAIELASKELTSNKLASEFSKELVPLLVKCSKRQPCKNFKIIIFLQNNKDTT
jgi:hypothetical protein